jgi:hypothetical protein
MDKKSKLLPFSIILAALILCTGLVVNTLPDRYKVVGNRVFDTIKGEYVFSESSKSNTSEQTQWTASDFKTKIEDENEGDFSKVIISGQTYEQNRFIHIINCTVKNGDEYMHKFSIKVIYYDENKNPITTQNSETITLQPKDIQGVKIDQMNAVEKIKSFELSIVKSNT